MYLNRFDQQGDDWDEADLAVALVEVYMPEKEADAIELNAGGQW